MLFVLRKLLMLLFLMAPELTHAQKENQPNQIILAQNITVEYLQRLLKDLKASGRVPQNATICSVDWLRFGILADVSCKTPSYSPNKSDAAILRKGHRESDVGLFVDCDRSSVWFDDCIYRQALTFDYNMSAISQLDALAVCEAVVSALHLNGRNIPLAECPVRPISTRLDTRGQPIDPQRASTFGSRKEQRDDLIVDIVRRNGAPPIFVGYVIARPGVLDNENGDHYERHDFIIYWAFSDTGGYEVNVEPIFAMWGPLDELTRIDVSSDKLLSLEHSRGTRVRPRSISRDIRDRIDALTLLRIELAASQ